jgi:lipopolysaccharide export LptBFGC system permease protein LptF
MSRTLFFYIFKDLLRIFLLTAGALAGIMSFGGLLRPLTEHGLDAGQVGKVLTYFLPAMTTYSLPIAALFATTVVYGRLSADNEITACRAAGISFASIGLPALVLGLIVALVSLLFLCFVVPNFFLRVERVIYSNLAQLVANEIDRTHQFRFEDQTIFAEQATVQPPSSEKPNEQVVTLTGVMVVAYDRVEKDDAKLQVPREFFLARSATVFINRGGSNDDEYSIEVRLDDSTMFPRTFTASYQGGMGNMHVGPITRASPIDEETKFMDIRRLHELSEDKTGSRKVRTVLREIIRDDQGAAYLQEVLAELNGPSRSFRFDAGAEVFQVTRGAAPARLRGDEIVLTRRPRMTQQLNGEDTLSVEADEIRISATPTADDHLQITLQHHNAIVRTTENETPHANFSRSFRTPMPEQMREIASRTPDYYLRAPGVDPNRRTQLRREMLRLGNGIHSEMHARASFAVSCLILVIVGCALGMMFRSGNFLNAFGISVAPALLCIALIVTGQHLCESVPWNLKNFQNPLRMGLMLIWSGNIAVLILAIVLGWRLQRQ